MSLFYYSVQLPYNHHSYTTWQGLQSLSKTQPDSTKLRANKVKVKCFFLHKLEDKQNYYFQFIKTQRNQKLAELPLWT